MQPWFQPLGCGVGRGRHGRWPGVGGAAHQVVVAAAQGRQVARILAVEALVGAVGHLQVAGVTAAVAALVAGEHEGVTGARCAGSGYDRPSRGDGSHG
jgi:hypothetical protein